MGILIMVIFVYYKVGLSIGSWNYRDVELLGGVWLFGVII